MSGTKHTALRIFFDSAPRGELARLARKLKISRVYLSQIVGQHRGAQPSTALAVKLEKETGVSRMLMRDDAALHWPELARQARRSKAAA